MRKNSRETPESQTDTDTGREAERQSRQRDGEFMPHSRRERKKESKKVG